MELELEAELQIKERAQQQELDDLNKMINDLEANLAEDDDEETLLQKIHALQLSNKELEAQLKTRSLQLESLKNSNESVELNALKKEEVSLNLIDSFNLTAKINKYNWI